jgi:serpin B
MAVLPAGCGDATGPEDVTITELPRALTVAERSIIGQGNTFGLELVARTVARDLRPNVVMSPLSASMALGMTLNGAAGTTFDAMRTTLGFQGLGQEEINQAYRGLLDLLTGLDPQVRFDIANSVWANKDVAFQQAFLDAVRAAFDARVESRDFRDSATLTAINGWVSTSTEGLIDRILDDLDPGLVSILINAIYFDGAWSTRFDPSDTRRQAFTREDGSPVQVDMMNLKGATLPMGGGPDYQAAELPYGGGAFSMVVVVPTGARSARDVLAGLDATEWRTLLEGLAPREVDQLSLPRFTLAWDGYLNQSLKDMGMGIAFGPQADFTRMTPGAGVCIDFVRQKTYIDVDERGTRAAAVTAVGTRVVSFNGLIVDRPFVFAIRERLSGTLLFVGLVGDPTAKDSGPDTLVSDCR